LSRLFCQDQDQDQDFYFQDQDQDQDFIFCPPGLHHCLPPVLLSVSHAINV